MSTVPAELWDLSESDQEAVEVVVVSDLPLSEATDRLLATIAHCWPNQDWTLETVVSATAQGPAMWINGHGEWDLRPVVQPIAAALPLCGLGDARLEQLRLDSPGMLRSHPTPFIEGRFAVGEGADPVAELIEWCFALPHPRRRGHLVAGMLCTALPEAVAAEVLAVNSRIVADPALDVLVWPHAKLIVEADGAFRMLTTDLESGYVSISDGTRRTADFDWQASLNAITSVMSRADAWADQAFAKRGGVWSDTGVRTLERWVPDPRPVPWRGDTQRVLERTHLLDAFGLMLLSEDKWAHVPDNGRWTAEPAGAAFLVRHVDSGAWFQHELPDASTHSTARDDLRGLLSAF
ncbi:hypothetical protein [Lentzea sp. NPDC051838]|uniref:hypothetical protein n=1 Tax=Lentzea sp. NPDC051838 TaxID=3154849 RepID=UPI003436847C